MATKLTNGAQRDRHRPGYKDHPGRKTMRTIGLFFTEAEFEAVTARVLKDGITKQDAGRRLFLNYAKHGLTNG